MIGPTGVGKTEISRRLAKLAQAPFLKSKRPIHRGWVCRPRRRTDRARSPRSSIALVRSAKRKKWSAGRSQGRGRVLTALVAMRARPPANPSASAAHGRTRRQGDRDRSARCRRHAVAGNPRHAGRADRNGQPRRHFRQGNGRPHQDAPHDRPVSHDLLIAEEADKLLDNESIISRCHRQCSEQWIVFLDEIDKISRVAKQGAGRTVLWRRSSFRSGSSRAARPRASMSARPLFRHARKSCSISSRNTIPLFLTLSMASRMMDSLSSSLSASSAMSKVMRYRDGHAARSWCGRPFALPKMSARLTMPICAPACRGFPATACRRHRALRSRSPCRRVRRAQALAEGFAGGRARIADKRGEHPLLGLGFGLRFHFLAFGAAHEGDAYFEEDRARSVRRRGRHTNLGEFGRFDLQERA